MKLPDRKSNMYTFLQENVDEILFGSLLCIDPSIGSNSSQPAFAFYQTGKVIAKGRGIVDAALPLAQKCAGVSSLTSSLIEKYKPSFVILEGIPAQSHGRNATGHATLLKAVGAILAGINKQPMIEITPMMWKARARPEYTKSDVNDAIEMGWVVIEMAKLMLEKQVKLIKKGK